MKLHDITKKSFIPQKAAICTCSILLILLLLFVNLAFFSNTVEATPVIVPLLLPAGQIGEPYNVTLSAVPLVLPSVWLITSGALPPGLALSPTTGTISGVPYMRGTYSFYIQVSDNTSPPPSTQHGFTIVINPPPVVMTATTLSGGTEGTPYSASFSASGGTTPYSWSLASGNLPSGLILNTNAGSLTGTPGRATAGTYNFTVRVADNSAPQLSAQTSFSLIIQKGIYPATINIDTSLLAGSTAVRFDGTQVANLKATETYTVNLDLGVSKTVTVDLIVPNPNNSAWRFRAKQDSLVVSEAQPNITFGYVSEYKIDVLVVPPQITSISGSGWYKKDDAINFSTKSEIPGTADMNYKFSHWLLPDNNRITTELFSFTVTSPGNVTAYYDTYYKLTTVSPYGEVQGAGWYKSGTVSTWAVVNEEVPMQGLLGFFQGKYKPVNFSGTENMDGPKTVTVIWEPDYLLPYVLIPLSIFVFILVIVGLYFLLRRQRPRLAPYPIAPMQSAPPPQVFPRPIPQQHTTVVMIGDKNDKTKQLPPSTREQLIEKFSQLLDTYETEIKTNIGGKGAPQLKSVEDIMISAHVPETNIVEAEVVKEVGESSICGVTTKKLLRTVACKWNQIESYTINLPAEDNSAGEHTGLSVIWARDIFHEWEVLNCQQPVNHAGKHRGTTRVVYSLLNSITVKQNYAANQPVQPPSPHFTDSMPEVEPDEDSIVSAEELPPQTNQ
jgi:hypothetical protein